MPGRRRLDAAAAMLLAAVAVTGCASQHAADDGAAAAPPVEAPEGLLLLTGCEGWRAFEPRVGGTGLGPLPAGWPPADPGDPVAVRIDAYRCQRVASGPLERGPVHLLLESHSDAKAPPACDGPAGTVPLVAAGAWTDDADLAGRLAAEGLPTAVAAFAERSQPLAAASLRTWEWWTPGQAEASAVTLIDLGEAGPAPPSTSRLFWPAGAGLALLELAQDDSEPLGEQAGAGTLQPPHLLGKATAGRFTGPAAWFPHREAAGAFTRFADTACEVPA